MHKIIDHVPLVYTEDSNNFKGFLRNFKNFIKKNRRQKFQCPGSKKNDNRTAISWDMNTFPSALCLDILLEEGASVFSSLCGFGSPNAIGYFPCPDMIMVKSSILFMV